MAFIGNFILRIIVILIGLSLAIMTAGVFVGMGLYSELLSSQPPVKPWEDDVFALLALAVGFVTTVILSVYIFGVGAILIALAELMHWKGFVTNLVMGGFVAGFLALTNFGGAGGESISDGALLVSLSAGFIGGFVYWLIAGRKAGDWLKPTTDSSSKS